MIDTKEIEQEIIKIAKYFVKKCEKLLSQIDAMKYSHELKYFVETEIHCQNPKNYGHILCCNAKRIKNYVKSHSFNKEYRKVEKTTECKYCIYNLNKIEPVDNVCFARRLENDDVLFHNILYSIQFNNDFPDYQKTKCKTSVKNAIKRIKKEIRIYNSGKPKLTQEEDETIYKNKEAKHDAKYAVKRPKFSILDDREPNYDYAKFEDQERCFSMDFLDEM